MIIHHPGKFDYYALKFCLVMIIVFILQSFIISFADWFVLSENSWSQPWRFLTAIFLHGSLVHLLYNLFALALFGSILERFIGGKRFLRVFFVTGILTNLVAVNFYSSSLGASGAIFGILGALILVRPGMMVWAFGLPMPIFIAGILWAIGDLIGAYGFLVGQPIDNTGNIAHISGMFFGLVFGWFYRKLIKRRGRKVNVSMDEDDVRLWEEGHLR